MTPDLSTRIRFSFHLVTLLGLLTGLVVGCGSSNGEAEQRQATGNLNPETLRQTLGMEGTVQNGRFKVTVPQNDLDVTVDGVSIIPPMGMGSWAAFAPAGDSAMVMGDVVLQEEEVKPVQQTLVEHDIEVVSIHNHMTHDEPQVFFLHYWGQGPAEQLAQGLRAALDQTGAAPANP